jgi:hypothetical protein
MSSTNQTITTILSTLDESWKALAEAHRMLTADSSAVPDTYDIVDLTTSVAAVSESLMAVNSLMVGRHASSETGS